MFELLSNALAGKTEALQGLEKGIHLVLRPIIAKGEAVLALRPLSLSVPFRHLPALRLTQHKCRNEKDR